jgi:isopentenyl diphosphate isomerase/L-lactate dehydrogenase-like FMN-dependent dehydrogenase
LEKTFPNEQCSSGTKTVSGKGKNRHQRYNSVVYVKDLEALDALMLLPRVIHDVEDVNPEWRLFDLDLPGPLLAEAPSYWPGRVTHRSEDALGAILLVPPYKMKRLVPTMREIRTLGAIAAGIDFSMLLDAPETRPRSSSDLCELKDALGLPFVVAGLLDPQDAERVAEVGADAIIASSSLSKWLGGPPLAQLVPDLRDAIGETSLLVRGGLRSGADVLRYLALGADAVVVPGTLNPHKLLEELSQVMQVTGCRRLEEISYDLIFEPTFDS